MCLEGVKRDRWGPIVVRNERAVRAGVKVSCRVCQLEYTVEQWDKLVSEFVNNPEVYETTTTTTMGGDSKGDSSSDNEVHTVVLTVYPNKSFAYLMDGAACNLCNIMDMMSKATEEYVATAKAATLEPVFASGTRNAYERLGRALGVAVPAPAAMNTEELSQQHTVNELLCAAHRRIKSLTMPLYFDADAKLHAKCVFDTVCGENPPLYDLARFSLQELLAHLNNRTSKAERAAQCAWISEVQDAVRQLHERVCGSATPPVCVHPPGECVRLPVAFNDLDDLDLSMPQLRRLAVLQLDKYWPDGMFSETDPVRKDWLEMIEGRTRRALVAAPAEPPKLKLAQRLAAFVEEKQSLEKAMREMHETVFTDIPWSSSAVNKIWSGSVVGSRTHLFTMVPPGVRGWDDGRAQRMLQDAGFKVDSHTNVRAKIDDADRDGVMLYLVSF